jgi:3-deoxy-D-manno-octulosonate 8-phosphate phosphatase (KDO 8-P phosphatase)
MPSEKPITDIFKGAFVSSPETIKEKLQHIKGYIFDWDGVFTNGNKQIDGSSSFNEIDSMGINLLRFNHYLKHNNEMAATAIITGEQNKTAFHFALREHLNDVYYKIKHKETALQHFCYKNNVQPSKVLFVFDDVLDFSVAKIAGVRIMIGNSCNALLIEYAIKNHLTDYVSFHNGANGAIREASELIMHLNDLFDETINQRSTFTKEYQTYFAKRNELPTGFYTFLNNEITEQHPL